MSDQERNRDQGRITWLEREVKTLRNVIQIAPVSGTVLIPLLVQAVPPGGWSGNVLRKYADGDYAATWSTFDVDAVKVTIGVLRSSIVAMGPWSSTMRVLGSSITGLSPVTTTLAALAGHGHSVALIRGAVGFYIVGSNNTLRWGVQPEIHIPHGLNVLGVEVVAYNTKGTLGAELWITPSFASRPANSLGKVTASAPINLINTIGYKDVALTGWNTSWGPGSYITPVIISCGPNASQYGFFVWGQRHTN